MNESIEQQIADLDAKILEAINNLNTVQIESAKKKRELFEIGEVVRIAKHNVASMKINKEILVREFWANKRIT